MRYFGLIFISLFIFNGSLSAQTQNNLEFLETTHDFGTIKEENGPVDHTFKFTNTSNESVKIQSVRASCGCTTPDWTREEVAPGEEGMVQARYNPMNRPGSFRKSLTVTTADSKKYILYIKGSVEPKPRTIEDDLPTEMGAIRVRYRAFNMGKVYDNATLQRDYQVYNQSEDTILFREEYTSPSHIKASFKPQSLAPKQKGAIVIEYDAEMKNDLGFLVDNLTFFTNEEGADSVKSFTVYASVEEYFPPMTAEELAEAPRLKFETTEYDFGSVKQGETVTAEFRFTNSGKTPLNIRKTAVSCGCTVAELETKTFEPGESSVLKVNFNSSGRRGNQQKSVTIFSNDPSNPTQRVVIKARVED